MTSLEVRYRRLLGVYPPDHRQAYGPEMLGVLMAGSRPGQRFPALGDALDLLRAGFQTRIGHSGRRLRSEAWRDACSVVALLTAVLLLAVAGRRLYYGADMLWLTGDPLRANGIDVLLMLDVLLRTVGWLAVVVAILLGRRRAAAHLGLTALLIEFGALIAWLPRDEFRALHWAWAPVLIGLCVATLYVSIPGASALHVLGRRGTMFVGAGVLVAALGVWSVSRHWPSALEVRMDLFLGMPEPVPLIVGTLVLLGLRCAGKRVWRRVLVLITPVVAVAVAQAVAWTSLDIAIHPHVTAPMLITLAAVLVIVPPVAFTLGLLILDRRENAPAVSGGETEVM